MDSEMFSSESLRGLAVHQRQVKITASALEAQTRRLAAKSVRLIALFFVTNKRRSNNAQHERIHQPQVQRRTNRNDCTLIQ